jgi:hypothetical protein
MKQKESAAAYKQLREWVKFQARPERSITDPWEKFLDYNRKMSTIAILGANFAVGVKQRLSMFSAANEIGWKWIIDGYKHMSVKTSIAGLESSQQWEKVLKLSKYMPVRQGNIDREMSDAVGRMSPLVKRFEIAGKSFRWRDVQDFMFVWIQMNDRATVGPVWMGAFNKSMSENSALAEAEKTAIAVEFADAIVRETQPSTLPTDLNSLQRSEGAMRLFTSFMTWMFKSGNRIVLKNQAYRSGAISTKEYLNHVFYELMLAPWGSLLIGTFLASGDIPEWWQFLAAPAENAVAWIPLVRDVSGALKFNKGLGTVPAGTAANEILNAGKTTWEFMEGDKEFNQVMWDVSKATAVNLGLPAHKVMRPIAESLDIIEPKKKKKKRN